jgi:RNA polymerase sigma factor (sigma-70 family)
VNLLGMSKSSKEEFTYWLSQRQLLLIAAARGICFDSQIAEDVLQEALVDVFKRWDKIRDHENLEAYTIRVMISKHADMRRKWNRKKYESEVELSEAFQLLDGSEDTDSILQSLMVQSALKSLGPMQRAVLLLHYQYGYTLRDIAHVLHIPPGTAASHLARGKAAVAEKTEFLPEIARNEKKALENFKEIDYLVEKRKRGRSNE